MSSDDQEEELDPAEESEPSTSDGSYTEETTPDTESESSLSDHKEEFDYDEETKKYSINSIEDWPDEVWQQHYELKRHVKKDTCYVIDSDTSQQWSVIDMISERDPVVLAHVAAYNDNKKFTYGDEQFTSAKGVSGVSDSYERPDRRLKTMEVIWK